jgi:hypothetical protein
MSSRAVRRECKALVANRQLALIGGVFGAEFFNVAGILLLIAAYSSGTMTLVTTLTSAQPLIVIGLLVILRPLVKLANGSGLDTTWSIGRSSVSAAILIVAGMHFLIRS